jgi:hypothetical protein
VIPESTILCENLPCRNEATDVALNGNAILRVCATCKVSLETWRALTTSARGGYA